MAARASSNGDGTSKPSNRRREAIRAAVRRPAKVLRLKAGRARRGARVLATANLSGPAAIYVSYSRDDIDIVRPLVEDLRAKGAAVTWDQDFAGGADFEKLIRHAIDTATSVIVVWSPASSRSRFVRDEATRALLAEKLITTHVSGFAMADVPLGFGHLNVIPVDDRSGMHRSLARHGIDLEG